MARKFKKEIEKLSKIIVALAMVFAMLFSYFAPITEVFASSNLTGKVTINVSGEELEYDGDDAVSIFFGINHSPEMRRLAKNEVDYITENNKIVGLNTKNAIDYEYDYDNEGTVTFHIMHQPGDIITSLKINNTLYDTPNTREALAQAYSREFRAIVFDVSDVPYQEIYNIEIEGRPITEEEEFMAGFLWTYDENTNEYAEDDKILHGTLEIVKVVYDNNTYTTIEQINNAGNLFVWDDGVRGTDDPTGEAVFPKGAVLTLRLIPDAGYQLTSFDLNGFPFEPGEEVGLYTFIVGGGPFHLGAHFTEVNDEVKSNSQNVKSGEIEINKNNDENFGIGTAKLEVNDVISMAPNRMDSFETKAMDEGYEIENYLDISLYNSIYKGGKKDSNGNYESWDTPVENINNKATITLELENDMKGKDLAIVHETHNGNEITGYELIDATYNDNDNTITFETDSFSNYAIVSKERVGTTEYTVVDSDGNMISFTEEENREFTLNIIDYLTFSEEDLEVAGIPKEMYDAAMEGIANATKKYGTLLAFYEIEVRNDDGYLINDRLFKIKIKMTDEMKKYNTFKIIYVDVDNGFATESPIVLTEEEGYLVGTLDHLSTYALVGSITPVAPATGEGEGNTFMGDGVDVWSGMLVISILGLSFGMFSAMRMWRKI